MKYRRLNQEELTILEKDFIKYLSSNSIAAEDWTKIKANEPKKMNEMILHFSQLVFEKSLKNIKNIEFISPKRIFFFQFNEKEAELLGIQVGDTPPIDFTKEKDFSSLITANIDQISFISKTKPYIKPREVELYSLLANGATLSDGKMFNQLAKLKK